MPLLTKEQAATVVSLRHEDVEVPEWGGSVRLVELSAAARGQVMKAGVALREAAGGADLPLAQIETLFLAYCMVDEKGEPLLTAEQLSKCSYAVVHRLFERADALNLFSVKATEAEAKN